MKSGKWLFILLVLCLVFSVTPARAFAGQTVSQTADHVQEKTVEKTVFIMLASVIGAMLNIILNYCLIKEFGYIAAGYTTFISYVLFVCTHNLTLHTGRFLYLFYAFPCYVITCIHNKTTQQIC